jgi:BirA family biotin operon repressor/biotin-[acetyl-CoA-carboxylase] ligase
VSQAFRHVILEEVGSTNSEAFERARAGEQGPLWIVARRQTHGRGRSGRAWASEPGNLYASLLQRLVCPQTVLHQLSLLAGVAVIDAIRAAAGGDVVAGLRLKWPNDVLIGGGKCAGILPESHSSAGANGIIVVIGVGINLARAPADMQRGATALAAHGVRETPESMLQHLAAAMQRWLQIWDAGEGFAKVRAAWRERAGPVGESVTINTGKDRITGTFLDLDSSGALIMRDAHGLQRRFTYGDVTLTPAERG